jgi:peptidyl-prolyl cis-trans isomerase A (cyclophilin A)
MRTSLTITIFAAGVLALAGSSWAADAPKAQAAAPAKIIVNFDTTRGPIVVEVHRDWAPIGADHFVELVKSGYFDGCRFFRVVPNFIVQFGIAADPAVTRKWKSHALPDDPVKQHNVRGTLVYATAGPNTRTTQLFINLVDNTRSLDGQGFAPFAQVTSGMSAVDSIFPGYGEAPQQPLIESQGNSYLEPKFPKLDYVRKATIQ